MYCKIVNGDRYQQVLQLHQNAQQLTLKLVRINLNYRLVCTNTAAFFFQMSILDMHLIPWINVKLDFICMSSVDI